MKMRNKLFCLIQLLALFPSTFYLGIIALTIGIGGIPAFIASFLLNYKELGIGYILTCIMMMAMYIIPFLIPGLTFILLWILIIKGADWVAVRPRMAFWTLILGSISCFIGLYFGLHDFRKNGVSILFLIPAIIGAGNFIFLAKKYSNSRRGLISN